MQAESGGTAFDRGTESGAPGENAFDGVNVINGAELMSESGSLRFVVGLNALAAGHDANGNMTLRLKDGARYFFTYDAENRLTSVTGTVSASFAYNGDGQRVTATIGTTTTAYIGGYFEWKDGAGKSYYFAGGQRVAMRTSEGVKYLLGDHLGSTAVTALASGAFDTGTRYYPWGTVRWSSGASPTDYMFTGQQNVASIGLYFYNARFYDAALGRFVQADTIIPSPGLSVAWDRYAYVANNPIKYTDPSGHLACNAPNVADGDCSEKSWATLPGLIASFGINLGEGFSLGEMWEILTALRAIGMAFSEVMEDHPDPTTAFRTVFSGVTLLRDSSISPMDGRSSADSIIRLRPGRITARLLGHELGHVFSYRMYLAAGNWYTDEHPETMLNGGLWDDNFFITGENRAVKGSPYRRNDLRTGYESGYDGDTVPDQYHWMSEIHPVELMDANSNSAAE